MDKKALILVVDDNTKNRELLVCGILQGDLFRPPRMRKMKRIETTIAFNMRLEFAVI